jgi:hypothetical protein
LEYDKSLFVLAGFKKDLGMNRLVVFVFVITLGAAITAQAQECGPGCPVCSGSGSSTGALVPSRTFISTAMFIPNGEEETTVFNLRAGVTKRLDLGIGYTVKSDKLIWSARWQPIVEDESSWRPSIILGTGSVQTGKNDQSIFVQMTKAFEFSEKFSVRFSLGVASLLPELDKRYLLANVTMTVTERWSPFVSYDGLNFHMGLSWLPTDWLFIAGLMVETKYPSILIGFRSGF